MKPRTALGIGVLIGLVLAVGVAVWWTKGPSESQVRRTVITTVQEEAPASFLVTGTMDIRATVQVDSSDYLSPDWLSTVLQYTQPTTLSLLRGTSRVKVQVPGRVSYGFQIDKLTPEMIGVRKDQVITVEIPELSVHSVEPDLSRLRVKSRASGWMRVFPSNVHEDVRKQALSGVRNAFAQQANQRMTDATQPKVNTARALEKMLTPPLKAAGIDEPRFQIRVGDRLSLTPQEGAEQTFRND